jgi:hypothetical protein
VAGIIVGSVGVTVYPSAQRFWADFKAQTQAQAEAAGRDLANQLSAHISQSIARAVNQGMSNPGSSRVQGQRTGAAFADAFATEVKTRLDAAARALGPRVKVDADTAPAVAQMETLRRQIRQTEADIRLGRLDDSAAVAQIENLRRQLTQLSTGTNNVRVRVDTAAAVAQLEALRAQIESVDKAASSTSSGGGGFAQLLRIAALLAPALIPIGAAAVPGVLALGAAAGVAALGVLGLKNNVDGVASQSVRTNIAALGTDLTRLEGIAARGILTGVNRGLSELHAFAPTVTGDVNALSHMVGDIFANSVQGATGTLTVFMPLILRTAQGVDNLSQSLAGAGQSQGLQSFFAYVSAEGPQVVAMFSALGTTISHLVQAAAPFGSIIVTGLTLFSNAVNEIPMWALTALVGILESYLLYRTVSTVFDSIGGAIERFGTRAAASASQTALAGTASTALTAGLGPLGFAAAGVTAVLGVGLVIWQRHQAAVQAAKQAIQGYTQALQEDNGVIGSNTRALAAKNLQDQGAFDLAKKIGVSQSTLTDAALGNADAQRVVAGAVSAANKAYADSITSTGQYAYSTDKAAQSASEAGNKLNGILGKQQGALQGAANSQDNYKAAMDGSGASAQLLSDKYGALSAQLGISVSAVQQYAKDLGATDKSSAGYASAIEGLAGQQRVADAAQMALTDATIAYGSSAGSAADQAKYLGAVLVSSQGDTLGVASAFAAAYGSVSDFKEQVKQDSALHTGLVQMANKLQGVNLATADLTTYTNIFSNAAAPAVTQALGGIQQQGQAAAEAWYQHQVGIVGAQQASQEASQVFQTTTHDALMRLLGDLGLNQGQAGALADNLFRMDNKTFQSDLIVQGLQSATEAIETLALRLANLNGAHFETYMALKYNIDANSQAAIDAANRYANLEIPGRRYGGIDKHFANGAITKAFASGGFNSSIAQIVPDGANVVFAEKGTGGEAFIPMGIGNRGRSTAILDEVAKQFGYDLTPRVTRYAAGGVNTPAVIGDNRGGGVDVGGIVIQEVVDGPGTAMAVTRRLERWFA